MKRLVWPGMKVVVLPSPLSLISPVTEKKMSAILTQNKGGEKNGRRKEKSHSNVSGIGLRI